MQQQQQVQQRALTPKAKRELMLEQQELLLQEQQRIQQQRAQQSTPTSLKFNYQKIGTPRASVSANPTTVPTNTDNSTTGLPPTRRISKNDNVAALRIL
eukprot:UN08025